MKAHSVCSRLILFLITLLSFTFALHGTAAVVFTTDTTLGPFDTNYDGNNIIVSNCTLTLDGPHGFLSLTVASGATITHSYSSGGGILFQQSITNEPQELTGTNPATLAYPGTLLAQTVTDSGQSITYTQDVDYVMLYAGGGTNQIARTDISSIPDGATVLVSYTVQNSVLAGLTLSITGNVQVAAGGVINANGRGYMGGPGAGRPSSGSPMDGSGGSYGGLGGTSSSNAVANTTYGYFFGPMNLGSSGGPGPNGPGAIGGGCVKISAGGNINVDGALLANGLDATNSRSGGGSGGSIWLIASSVSGSGSMSANGGAGEPIHGGGGGGGRIAIQADTLSFSGTTTAYGGGGWQFGGAGTVFTSHSNGISGAVLVDNGGRAGTNTLLNVGNGVDVTVRNAGVLATTPWSVNNLVIGSNGVLQVVSMTLLSISATANVSVQSGGALVADRAGYSPGSGPGMGVYYSYQGYTLCGGGGHGGYGGSGSISNAFGGNVYDSQSSPNQFGSGGAYAIAILSGYGGGSIRLNIIGALLVNGQISANGGDGIISGGGGSGGSVWINASALSGSGIINANGGNGADSLGGGGGGGRVALIVTSNTFTGTLAAYGGSGANWGGAGPIYFAVSVPQTNQLIVDNGGHVGTNSAIQPATTGTALIVRNGAGAVENFPPMTFGSLLIGSNSWMTAPGGNYPGQVNLTITGNATIQHGGAIVTDAVGSGPGLGSGAGRVITTTPYTYVGGAGHGGYGGGTPGSTTPVGGNVYDLTVSPSINGSGGGQLLPNYLGGAGGGWIRLNVTGTLQMDGRLSANGGNGSGLGGGGGGGSGGSIWLTLGKLSGSGSITANGGNGGSGGGGGRISISYNTNSFLGTLAAYGGGWSNWGGAGSIYIKTNNQPYPTLVLDNGGNVGTNSGFNDFPLADITVAAGAVASTPNGASVRNLLVRSNGTVAPFTFVGASQSLTVQGNATIDPGGAISLDGLGYGYGSGPGRGFGVSYPPGVARGGAGHGGFGAGNPVGTGTGGAYDTIVGPSMPGSGGGGSGTSIAPFGGAGGGALRLTVLGIGTLTVNGRLSADGKDGDSAAGGGSGGALWISTGTLAGTGIISANGGVGPGAGGGGGGRIAITCTSNRFTGPITAKGGSGLIPGGAGTVYLSANRAPADQLTIDNGGQSGTNTPLSAAYALPNSPFNLTISGGASGVAMNPLPLLSNLTVSTGSLLTGVTGQSNLTLAVLGNANLATNAGISVAGLGYPQSAGPGAGATLGSKGAGGGYGGAGGASASGALGGTNYGSLTQPIDLGSGGGMGANTFTGGSDGGGTLRLSVGGTLNIDGALSADGNIGIQDDSGGGSGGSIWISANRISGAGAITANGANGDLYGGGGGGGGRIAIYSSANTYTGLVTMLGGAGANFGQAGTLYVSSNLVPFQVLSNSPAGIVSNLVSFVDLTFNDAINPYTVSASGFTLFLPGGPPMPPGGFSAAASGVSTVRVSFPVRNTPGDYLFTVRSGITNLLGQPISQVYTGAFTIAIPTIAGRVTDTNGLGVADVILQPSDTFYPATTDPSGYYSLGVPPGWNGTITPSFGTSMFVPSFLSFTNVTVPITGQDFLMVDTIAPLLSSSVSGGNFNLSWPGIAGVSYQAYSSTNLTDWQPWSGPLPGTNGLMQLSTPIIGQPAQFFRIQASD